MVQISLQNSGEKVVFLGGFMDPLGTDEGKSTLSIKMAAKSEFSFRKCSHGWTT